jgi:hypothetical protein
VGKVETYFKHDVKAKQEFMGMIQALKNQLDQALENGAKFEKNIHIREA